VRLRPPAGGSIGAQRAALCELSNYGPRIDLTAPGGDLPFTDLIVGLSNNGTTVPKEPDYTYYRGTSMAAPMVSGVAALLFARDGLLTGGRVLDHLARTARAWPVNSRCVGRSCAAPACSMRVRLPARYPAVVTPPNVPRGRVLRSDVDHYHHRRSGGSPLHRYVPLGHVPAPDCTLRSPTVGACRNGAPLLRERGGLHQSHYWPIFDECLAVLSIGPTSGTRRRARSTPATPTADARPTLPVYRFFDGRRDANHRYLDLSVRRAMLNRAWIEGAGVNGMRFSPKDQGQTPLD
jgi:hypothetical protein